MLGREMWGGVGICVVNMRNELQGLFETNYKALKTFSTAVVYFKVQVNLN